MQRTAPPFRADHVGSLLRPAALKEARAKHAEKKITDAQLAEIEDREIEKVIRKQEEVGLKLATDGEFRRSWWHFDFFRGLKGVEPITTATGIQFHGVETKHEGIKIAGKVEFVGHPQIEHFKFLKAHCRVVPKMCIPAPSTFHFRQGRALVSKDVYPDTDQFFADVGVAWRKAIRAFYDAGCRYLQLDDTAWAMIESIPTQSEQDKKRIEAFQRMTPEKIAPLAIYLGSDAAADINGQIFSVRNNEIYLFNQPRPIKTIHRAEGWTPEQLATELKPALAASFTALERSEDVFNWDPV